jgi:uracil-DNA glycosylase
MIWKDIIEEEKAKLYFQEIMRFVYEDSKKHTIYPQSKDIFNAFKYCPLNDVRVCILGADPYINPGQAHGLSFSVHKGIDPPPSLLNIYKELKDDLNIDPPSHGCLIGWAKQGVLLLNSVLTVRQGQSGSHKPAGWETFTDQIIRVINEQDSPIVYLLWGSFARSKKHLLGNPKHLVMEAPHPSPLSAHRGFFGSKPFSQTNHFLTANGSLPIDWAVLP